MAEPHLQFLTAIVAIMSGVFYFLFSTTVLLRAKLANKIGLSLFQMSAWLIISVLLLALIIYADIGAINSVRAATASNFAILGALFLAELVPFLLAFLVPLDEVSANYEEVTRLVKAGGTAAGAGAVGKIVAKQLGANEKGFDAVGGAGVAIGFIGMMSLVNFSKPPWSLIRTIILGIVGLFSALTIIFYLLGI